MPSDGRTPESLGDLPHDGPPAAVLRVGAQDHHDRADERRLDPQQFALLTLAGNPSSEPLTIGDLARQTFATMNTTSALVRRMERSGLVRTTRSSRDRRFVYVKLTPLGERRLRPSTAAVVEALRAAADEQGRAQLRAAFEAWFDNWGSVIKALSSDRRRPRSRR